MRALALLSLALLGACAEAPDVEPAIAPRFSPRPVMVQAALQDCEAHCEESLDRAVLLWVDQGVSMTIEDVDLGSTSQLGIAVVGVVAVQCGKLSTWPKRVHGETRYFHSVGGDILAAEVVLASCEVHAVAHELGHALLGKAHRNTRENVMHEDLMQAGWVLDSDQLLQARDW